MSKDYWNPYPPQMTWHPPSHSSDVMLQSQMEQMRSLGRIEEAVRPIPEMRERIEGNTVRITRLEDKLDGHIQTCQPPRQRRKVVSFDALKENWTVVLLVVQLVVYLSLQMVGQPDKAEQAWASSPAFRERERAQD